MDDSPRCVLLVERTTLFRESLAAALRTAGWAATVLTGADAADAVRRLDGCRPDVVLLGASASVAAEVDVLRRALPGVRVIAIAGVETDDAIVRSAEAGVASFLPDDATIDELRGAVEAVLRGESVCSPRVAGVLLRRLSTLAGTGTGAAGADACLTPREREVLYLVEQGLTNKEIARRLSIEVRTVKNHVHNLMEKLRVHRRGEAAARLRGARVPASPLLVPVGAGVAGSSNGHGRTTGTGAPGTPDPAPGTPD